MPSWQNKYHMIGTWKEARPEQTSRDIISLSQECAANPLCPYPSLGFLATS